MMYVIIRDPDDQILSRSKMPTVAHLSFDSAKNEAVRLAASNPYSVFRVYALTAVGEALSKTVEWREISG